MDHRKQDGGGVNRTNLAQDEDQWRAIVDTRMNLRVP
jgi:hypothetical protein